MPIRIPNELPAQGVLNAENIFVMDSDKAAKQDIRPLEVGIVNLMPNKIETEVQILRLLSNTPLQINIDLIRIDNQAPKHTPKAHMDNFYLSFDDIAHKNYDGLIITGAPLAHLDYTDVKYWQKITTIMDWSRRHTQSTLYSCWAAHAAMYYYYGRNRQLRKEKLSGVFLHDVYASHDELVRGFDPQFWAPHSRFGEIPVQQYQQTEGLQVLAGSEQTGAYLVASKDKRLVFLTGHPEYDGDTLAQEYQRDLANQQAPGVPQNYFQANDPSQPFQQRWRAHGTLLFTNWLNYYVYQTTPFDLADLPSQKPKESM